MKYIRRFTQMLCLVFLFKLWSSPERLPAFSMNTETFHSLLSLVDFLLNQLSNISSPSESTFCWSGLFGNDTTAFLNPKQRCLRAHMLLQPAGRGSPEWFSCDTKCSVLCATPYLLAARPHGPGERRSAKLPFLLSQMRLSAASYVRHCTGCGNTTDLRYSYLTEEKCGWIYLSCLLKAWTTSLY